MNDLELPTWLYSPLKIVLVAGLLVPPYLWVTQLAAPSANPPVVAVESNVAKPEPTEAKRPSPSPPPQTVSPKVTPTQDAPAASPPAAGEPARGVDVSHYQGTVNWSKVAEAGITFAYVKATNGKHFVDPKFHQNWHGLRTTHLYRGAYHFFLAGDDPVKQAEHFIKTMGELRAHDLPPMLDVEVSDHASAEKVEEGALVWLQTVEKAMGRRPVLYTDNGFADRVLTDTRFTNYPLWIAEYADDVHRLPKPWKGKGWVIWQYSQKGKVDGIDGHVDMDRFNGGVEKLKEFIDASVVEG